LLLLPPAALTTTTDEMTRRKPDKSATSALEQGPFSIMVDLSFVSYVFLTVSLSIILREANKISTNPEARATYVLHTQAAPYTVYTVSKLYTAAYYGENHAAKSVLRSNTLEGHEKISKIPIDPNASLFLV
jgi:hypothetical protein